MPTVQCPHCGAKLKVKESALGKNGRCPSCQAQFLVELPRDTEPHALASGGADELAQFPAPNFAAFGTSLSEPSSGSSPPRPGAAKGKQAEPAERPKWLLPAVIGGVAAGFVAAFIIVPNLMKGGGVDNVTVVLFEVAP